MFNLDGIRFRLFACDFLFLFVGILALISSKFWKPQQIIKRDLHTGCVLTIGGMLFIAYHLWILWDPHILSCTGTYLSYRSNPRGSPPWPVTLSYVFDTGEGKKRAFHLDTFSKKKIFPEDELVYGDEYLIYYEDQTNIIVRIEPIE